MYGDRAEPLNSIGRSSSNESSGGQTVGTNISVVNSIITICTTGSGVKRKGIMDRILQSNPILEAFGNARTIRNDNSSRFGKFINLAFNKDGVLVSGAISIYLLENVRVVSQQRGDQNFHIFYEMIVGSSPEQRRKWKLTDETETWGYLMNQKLSHNSRKHYFREFDVLHNSLVDLDFSTSQVDHIFSIIAGLLHFGQITFKPEFQGSEEGSTIDTPASLLNAAVLCGFNGDTLKQALTLRCVESRGEVFKKKLLPAQAINARDAVVKIIYKRLFEWMVHEINQHIAGQGTGIESPILALFFALLFVVLLFFGFRFIFYLFSCCLFVCSNFCLHRVSPHSLILVFQTFFCSFHSLPFFLNFFKITTTIVGAGNGNDNRRGAAASALSKVGVLDIFGFESLNRNGLEQLCINFANESLHQQFTGCVFKTETQEYEREKIKYDQSFEDNQVFARYLRVAHWLSPPFLF
jgi:myosin heavy subunit